MKHRSAGVVTAAGFALASGIGGTAQAQLDRREWQGDLGLYAAFHFGPGIASHFGAGIEARALYRNPVPNCDGGSYLFGGGVARLALVGFDQVRLLVGPVVGGAETFAEIDGDLGLGYRWGREPGFIAQPTFGARAGFLTARVGYALPRELSIALGGRLPSMQFGCYVVGRPLRRDGAIVAPPASVLLAAASAQDRGDDVRVQAAHVWGERAATEWASVPAFWELAAQLETSGAPADLAARARAAAADEVRHAEVAATIAARLSGGTVMLAPPARNGREVIRGNAGLARLAVESWQDGALGEGLAAAMAQAESQTAGVAGIASAQASIALDEAAHAALAWDVLRWAAAADRAGVEPALTSSSPSLQSPAQAGAPMGLGRFGCLAIAETPGLVAKHRALAETRMAALLLPG